MESEPRGMEYEPTRRAPRRVIGSYGSYAEVQRAVDHLSDKGFPVERVSIVAEELRFVEQVTEHKSTVKPRTGLALCGGKMVSFRPDDTVFHRPYCGRV